MPNNPYSASKAAADMMCRAYYRTYSLPVMFTRFANAFGPYQYPEKLFPLDVLSASLLTLALQRYGQNQRSLFSFIDSNSYLSIGNFELQKEPYYNLACVYDYLIFHYFSLLSTKYNPDYAFWASIKNSIERVEDIFEDRNGDAIKIIKTIGLLQMFAHKRVTNDKCFIDN